MVQNRKENCHHDHIPFNVEGNVNRVCSVWCYVKSFHLTAYMHIAYMLLGDYTEYLLNQKILTTAISNAFRTQLHLSCLRSYYSLNGPHCLSYLFKLIDCMRINYHFYYEIVQNKWFNDIRSHSITFNSYLICP